jgi:hypothetical protein
MVRGVFYHLYFEFLHELELQPLAPSDVLAGTFVEDTSLFSTPGYLWAQVRLRELKRVRCEPKVFASAMIGSHRKRT